MLPDDDLANLVQLPVLQAPLAADFKRAANIRAEFVIAAAALSLIEPRTRAVDRPTTFEISAPGRGRCGQQSLVIG